MPAKDRKQPARQPAREPDEKPSRAPERRKPRQPNRTPERQPDDTKHVHRALGDGPSFRSHNPVKAGVSRRLGGSVQREHAERLVGLGGAVTQIQLATVGSDGTLSESQRATRSIIPVTFAASVTPALPASGDAVYKIGALTGAITIHNPSGAAKDGQFIQFLLAQDGTGGRVITWGAAYQFGTDVTQALIPTTASAKWRMLFAFNATTTTWQALAIARGL